MTTLSIKGVPEAVAQALRARAARHHRSLQGELLDLVTRAALEALPTEASSTSALPPSSSPTKKTLAEIAAEHRARLPALERFGPSATALIRKERDAR